ncbi:MAG: hypothetical protein ICV78_00685 [Tolypothrix sp. Co-bin9]|nr:hypothetical protein [Tolypothrix sp. Co-bin9]
MSENQMRSLLLYMCAEIAHLEAMQDLLVLIEENSEDFTENNFKRIHLLADIYRSHSECCLDNLNSALHRLSNGLNVNCDC